MSPSGRAVAIGVVIAVAALALPGPVVVVLALLLVGATIGDALMVRRPPTVDRVVPSVAARGRPFTVEASVVGRRAGTVVLRQPVPGPFDIDEDTGARLQASVLPRHRGRWRLPALAARSTGPLGLGRWDHRVGAAWPLAVYPDLPSARVLAGAVRAGTARDLAVLTRGATGLGTELERVRDYLPDDDLRQVNWRATARMGRPMSNEYRLDEDRDVILVVDAGRLMAAPLGDRQSRLDVALDAAAAVAMTADVVGDRCGTIAFADRIVRRVDPRRAGGRSVVDALFDLEPSLVEADYQSAFRAVTGSKRACVVVLTDLIDEAAARSLAEAVPVLARRHALIVASAVDDDLVGIVAREASSGVDVYEAVVAIDVLDARERAARRLTAAGARVVEAPAGRLGHACVRAYLTMKARARL